ncbi:MAG: hypothetical protein A2V84_09635 [Chloroflexi bacterium RBG_16_70_13]|nr:MAG: hypothetical protein A2V84_09635 [Chloroflexi bacterium RBG_16_70_13]
MPNPVIATRRLDASGLLRPRFTTPEDVVRRFGAVQSQDYPGASWGIGQRLGSAARQADIDAALDEGRIVRTHALRPTWHFLHPADIGWILRLTSPRVEKLNAQYYRRTELDEATLGRSVEVMAQALEGGQHLTRSELSAAMVAAGIDTRGQRLSLLVMHAELEGVICSGPRRGRQFTYARLDSWVPPAPDAPADRAAALAELTRRYFTSHGPAEPRDFAWWSGLAIADAKAGLANAGPNLVSERIDGTEWWWAPPPGGEPALPAAGPLVQLLPNYDEYRGSYRDHGPTFDSSMLGARWVEAAFAAHLVVRDGMAIGGWKREVTGRDVVVRPDLLTALDPAERLALESAAAAYGRFLDLPAQVDWGDDG